MVIKSRRMKWSRHVVHMGWMRNSYKMLVGKRGLKRPPRRCKHRWEDNIKMGLKEIACKCELVSSDPSQGLGFCEYGNELSGFIESFMVSNYYIFKMDSTPWSFIRERPSGNL
jgi:hypothetical protein